VILHNCIQDSGTSLVIVTPASPLTTNVDVRPPSIPHRHTHTDSLSPSRLVYCNPASDVCVPLLLHSIVLGLICLLSSLPISTRISLTRVTSVSLPHRNLKRDRQLVNGVNAKMPNACYWNQTSLGRTFALIVPTPTSRPAHQPRGWRSTLHSAIGFSE
jgi:hypothetical protein